MLDLEKTTDHSNLSIPAELVILSVGVKPNTDVYDKLLAAGQSNVWKLGDANACAKIVDAVLCGHRFAMGLA